MMYPLFYLFEDIVLNEILLLILELDIEKDHLKLHSIIIV